MRQRRTRLWRRILPTELKNMSALMQRITKITFALNMNSRERRQRCGRMLGAERTSDEREAWTLRTGFASLLTSIQLTS